MKKKNYSAPKVKRVDLTIKNTVLAPAIAAPTRNRRMNRLTEQGAIRTFVIFRDHKSNN